jgi:hypothetical protein
MANIDDEYRSSDDEEYVPEDESGSESDEDGDKLANDECLDDEMSVRFKYK